MEISIIPRWILKYLSTDFLRQNDISILLSNLILIGTFILFKNSVVDFLNEIPHFCLIDRLLGVECPVCGITRGFCELSNGNLSKAFTLNSSTFPVALFFILQIPLRIFSLLNRHLRLKINFWSKYLSNTILVLIMVVWITKLLINNML